MNIVIDTNNYLSTFELSKDDLEELRKMAALIRSGEIVLFLPEQVENEFNRRRQDKITKALKDLKKQNVSLDLPVFAREYEENNVIAKLLRESKQLQSKLIEKIEKDIENSALPADEVIRDLFGLCVRIETTDTIFEAASRRNLTGMPPGKSSKLGDEIVWESILEALPDSEDVYMISADGDYFSSEDKYVPMRILEAEWKSQKGSVIHFYKRISQFTLEHFPKIKLASEYERELAVERLEQSPSFQETHAAISQLTRFEAFTENQIDRLVSALNNNQVSWVLGDPDVLQFYEHIASEFGEVMSEETNRFLVDRIDRVRALLQEQHNDVQDRVIKEDEIPF